MDILERLKQDLKTAIHEGDARKVMTLRMVFASIKNKEIEERKKEVGLGAEEVMEVLQKEAKKRRDAILEFERGGRADLADGEKAELAIISVYLPQELSDEEVKRIIQDGIRELGGSPTQKDFGALMKIVMPTLKNRASGDRVTKITKEMLGA